MDIIELSIIHHIGIVLALIWIASYLNCCHPIVYFASLIYLYQVHERYAVRLRKKLQYEERKQANQKRLLSDSESVRWLNHAVEKVWPICMEQITSQKILLPIIPWFLEKYKPWTAKEAVVQHLYLGRNPPTFTEIRVLRQSSDDDHLVLELGMNFLTAEDMSAILAVKLRRRLGFGMWAKLHITGMHVEGKVLVGVKFLRDWPFLGRLRVCFVEPPYFQMTVKPIVSHGFDVTELPGIAGWLDKLMAMAFEQTLIEPNMLVVDMEKFASASAETWFTVDEKDPIAYAKVEVIEAADMKPSDMNGLADPYVKGQLGPYRFRTKTQKKTLAPKWLEEFKIPICTWDSPNVLALEVRDKDYLVDDTLGDCSINISDLRSGQRQDIWLPLKNIKIGRLHLAVTVLDVDGKEGEHTHYDEPLKKEERTDYVQSESAQRASNPNISLEKDPKIADDFEPINIEGQEQTGIWVHHPGSDVSKMWEPRKRKSKRSDINIHKENKDAIDSPRTNYNPNSRSDENAEGSRKVKPLNVVRRSLRNIGSTFHRSPRNEDHNLSGEISPSPRVNLHAINERGTVVNFIVDDDLFGATNGSKESKEILSHTERNEGHNPTKGHMKGMGKSILKHAERSAHGLKHVLSRKSSNKSRMDSESTSTELENTNSSDEESQLSSMQYTPKDALVPVDSTPTPTPVLDRSVESHEHKKQNDQIGATGSELPPKSTYIEERDMEVPPNVVGRD